ncbi:vWA domain-containing protein [Lentzea sp. NPDC004789]
MRSARTPTSSSEPASGHAECRILPIYLVCDLSASMAAGDRAAAMRDSVTALRDAIWANPVVSDAARVGVIGFAGSAWVVLPLCDIAAVDEIPALTPAGLTSYSSAFRLLAKTIEADVAQLAADEFAVWRPMVFFISDGEPTDSRAVWAAELDRLVHGGSPWHPEIVSFAIGDASPATLAQVATTRCFAARSGEAVEQAISGIADLVIRSVVASGTAGAPVLPRSAPAGFDEVDLL